MNCMSMDEISNMWSTKAELSGGMVVEQRMIKW